MTDLKEIALHAQKAHAPADLAVDALELIAREALVAISVAPFAALVAPLPKEAHQ